MLVLFDIDGTLLLKASEAHVAAVHEAIREVYGVHEPSVPRVSAAGRTDGEIAREICLLAGLTAERYERGRDDFRAACVAAYARLCPPNLSAHVAPGAEAVLEALAAREDAVIGLVTGNLEPIARLKLHRAGLGRFFDHAPGGFGSDAEDRTELPEIARRRAGGVPRARTVVVGDTPLDIACARADGVRCVAIATGPFGEAELSTADVVLRSLRELPDVL